MSDTSGSSIDPRRVRELYDRIADLPRAEATAILERECAGDSELRRELESLLGHVASARSFLDPPTAALQAPRPLLAEGDEVGDYRILGPLGHGGHGSVHLAEPRGGGGARVALKTVHAPGPAFVDAIRREIHTLARMRHPGVVRILAHGIEGGLPWYAMELVEGRTLATLQEVEDPATAPLSAPTGARALEAASAASAAPAPPPDLLRALAAIHALCAPLGYLHGEGIVHRDLKPGNVMLRPDGTPVIVDFGVAARLPAGLSREVVTPEGAIVGTVLYMAPEQIRGELVDARADLYALGVILYQLVTGRPPFTGKEAADVLRMHLEAPPLPPSELRPGLPPSLDALVARLLQKDPRDRLGFASDVATALEDVAAELGAPLPGTGAAPAAPHRAYLYRPRLAGRATALAELAAAMERARRGRGGITLIAGESGIGKTRLVMEAGRMALKRGLVVLMGECQPFSEEEGGGAVVPLQPLRRPLQAVADRCRERGDAAEILGEGGPLLALYEPELATLSGVDAGREVASLPPALARRRLFGHLHDALAALSREAPLLLVMDDLQWADDLSLGFLEHLAAGPVEGIPLLLLGTLRSEESSERLTSLARARSVTRMALPRLDEAAVGAMMADMLALPRPDPALAAALSREAEGNPFFVAEYLRSAVQERVVDRGRDGRFKVATDDSGAGGAVAARLELPSSLRELIAGRLATLSPPALRLAGAGAVLGAGADEGLLLEVSGLRPDDGLPALEELLTRQVLEELDGGRLRFTHDKIRQVAYAGVEEPARVAAHRASAEGLERRADREVNAAAIGRHWERAAVPDRARESYLQGARRSAERYALAEASELYLAALRLAGAADAATVAIRVELGHRVLGPLGRRAEAVLEIERALADCREIPAPEQEPAACRALAHLYRVTGRAGDARRLYERALESAAALGDTENERRALEQAGTFHQQQGEMERARELYERALALHRAAGDRKNEASALANLATLHHQQRRLDEARELYRQAIEAFREARDRRLEGDVLSNLGALELEMGRLESAEAMFREALEVARGSAHRSAEMLALGNLGISRFLAGDLASARELHESALAIALEMGDPAGEGASRLSMAEILSEEGRYEEGLVACDRVTGDPRLAGDAHLQGAIRVVRAGILRRAGRSLDEAAALLEQAGATFGALGDRLELAKCRCQQGHLRLARDARPEAELREVRAIVAALGVGAASELGRLHAQLERSAAARDAGAALRQGEISAR